MAEIQHNMPIGTIYEVDIIRQNSQERDGLVVLIVSKTPKSTFCHYAIDTSCNSVDSVGGLISFDSFDGPPILMCDEHIRHKKCKPNSGTLRIGRAIAFLKSLNIRPLLFGDQS